MLVGQEETETVVPLSVSTHLPAVAVVPAGTGEPTVALGQSRLELNGNFQAVPLIESVQIFLSCMFVAVGCSAAPPHCVSALVKSLTAESLLNIDRHFFVDAVLVFPVEGVTAGVGEGVTDTTFFGHAVFAGQLMVIVESLSQGTGHCFDSLLELFELFVLLF
jgi:hypothetical protein